MPEFVNPFSGMAPAGKLTDTELARAIRLDIAAEQEAVHLYEAHAEATDNKLAKSVLLDIAEEERVHGGEFQRLLNILVPKEAGLLERGTAEVNEMAEKLAVTTGKSPLTTSVPTIGSLKKQHSAV